MLDSLVPSKQKGEARLGMIDVCRAISGVFEEAAREGAYKPSIENVTHML
jgi:hypothetical protein